ncbi:hypothetical protein GGI42DRAFT_320061 [Trichoderma sp. SZMC 28013]
MVFSHKARTIKLIETIHQANRRNHNLHTLRVDFDLEGKTRPQVIDLDECLGANEGQFSLGGNGFSSHAKLVMLTGSTLSAKLPFGNNNEYMQAELNLDLVFFYNEENKEVEFIKPSRQIHLSCSEFSLKAGSELSALCLRKDGRLQRHMIDLNEHLGFVNYALRPGLRGFRERGRNGDSSFWLQGLTLHGQFLGRLTPNGNELIEGEFDLTTRLENLDGKLTWTDELNFRDRLFSRDSVTVQYLEAFPVAGLIAAFVHRLAGNNDEAARAFTKSTGATIIYAGCLLANLVTANPIGLALVAGFLTPIAILAEKYIAEKTIQHADTQKNLMRSAEDYLKEIVVNSLAAGGTGTMLLQKMRLRKPEIEESAKLLHQKSMKQVFNEYVEGNISTIVFSEMWDLVDGALKLVDGKGIIVHVLANRPVIF